jgi:pimeloyl-ACP methyl ester carboxylesterase
MALSHLRAGSGPPLLLIHGIGHSLACWRHVTPHLRGFETFAIDLPGFGASPPLAEPPTLAALARACAAFMAEQGHERFHVAGNSLGGGIALHLALDGTALSGCGLSPVGFAEGVAERANVHLTLLASRAAAPAAARVIAGAPALLRRASAWSYADRADRIPPAELAATFRDLAAAPGFAATRRHAINWRCPRVERTRVPVTIAWGEHDRLLLAGPQSARARERLPDATHVTLRDCGHLPTWDGPERVAEVLRRATAP